MGKVHVRKITLQAFRAFQDKQSSPLLPRTGLVGIRGRDVRTGVSSGSGKSTIPLAITYAFGFCPFAATEQQNLYSALPMQVELELDTDSGPAIIKRGKEFSITRLGETVSSPAKEVEREIVKLTGLPTTLLEALTYRQQGERGRFLSMTDGEKREFLATLLGVKEVEDQIAVAIATSNTLKVEVDQLEHTVTALKTQLREPALPSLESTDAYRKNLEEIDNNIHVMAEKRHAFEDALKVVMEPLNRFYKKPKLSYVVDLSKRDELVAKANDARTRIEQLKIEEKVERKKMSDEAAAIGQLKNKLRDDIVTTKKVQEQNQRLGNEIEKLKLSICPTCSRQWEDAKKALDLKEIEWRAQRELIVKLPELELLLARYEIQYNELLAQAQQYKHPMLEKMSEVHQILSRQYEAEKSRIDNEAKLFEAQQAAEDAAVLEQLRKPVEVARKALEDFDDGFEALVAQQNAMREKIKTVESANERIMRAYADVTRQYEAGIVNIKNQELILEGKRKSYTEEADLAVALKHYLTLLFDEVLAQISAETNELLKSVPNVPTTTVTFVSEGVTAKGAVKQEIKPVVLKNGKPVSLKSGISGGMLESVELAVDLSIAKVIGQRTGVRPGFMIFDESFSAHCPPTKEACMQILQKAAEECLILVVDHSSELKEYFAAYIDVESERDVSRFAISS